LYELIPIFAGLAAGVTAVQLRSRAIRAAVVLAIALAAALLAGVLSRELYESWAFLIWDTCQAILVAALATAASPALRRLAKRA
jgi:hypothetical protein